MNVLVTARANKDAPIELGFDVLERAQQGGDFFAIEKARNLETTHVSFRAHDVVVIEDVVKRIALGQVPERRVHRGRKPSTPECHGRGGVAFLAP